MPQLPPDPLPIDPENPYVLVPLHQYPEFTFQCATLLNLEWPRSRQARLNSLWSCSKNFPVGMVLVQTDEKKAVGFCKISLIPNVKGACFVESVVVQPEMRGKGLGSLLMVKLEDYVLSRKLDTLYLSTLGQEKFYKKLGYDECEPVSMYSFGIQSNSTAQPMDGIQESKIVEFGESNDSSKPHLSKNHNVAFPEQRSCNVSASPPTHPPPILQPKTSSSQTAKRGKKKKSAYLAMLAPPLPPPPPPPLPKMSLSKNVLIDKTYMKKKLREC